MKIYDLNKDKRKSYTGTTDFIKPSKIEEDKPLCKTTVWAILLSAFLLFSIIVGAMVYEIIDTWRTIT